MRLRVVAPVPVDLSVVAGAAVRDVGEYQRFWKTARATVLAAGRMGAGVDQASVTPIFLHAPVDEPGAQRQRTQYRSIATDDLERPLEVVRFDVGPGHVAAVLDRAAPEVAALLPVFESARLDLMDDGIMVVECSFQLSGALDEVAVAGDEVDARLEAVSTAGQEFVCALVSVAMTAWVRPVLDRVREVSGADRVIEAPLPQGLVDPGPALGVPMWVARQLTVPRPRRAEGDAASRIVDGWLRDVPADGTRSHAEVLAAGDADHVTRWLHYVVVDDAATGLDDAGERDRGRAHADDHVWRALHIAQWTYASLDVVDRRLAGILAQAMADDDRWELRQLRAWLERLARRATLVQLQRDEASKYLQREVRHELLTILDWWDFDDLVADPVMTKVGMCRERIEELEQERARRSRFVTDLILQALVITSILGTILTLAQFGRSITTDPSFSGADVGRGNVVGWFAAQPADALLVLSAGVSILFLLVYVYLRRFHQ